jgi:hypothetical protein
LGDRRTLGRSGSIRSHRASGMRKSATTVVRDAAITHLPAGECLYGIIRTQGAFWDRL